MCHLDLRSVSMFALSVVLFPSTGLLDKSSSRVYVLSGSSIFHKDQNQNKSGSESDFLR